MRVKRGHALAELIDQVKRDTQGGLSDEDIARRARSVGLKISKQHVANLRAQDPLKSLVPSTLRAIAAGLERPLEQVVQAALEAANLPTGAPVDWSAERAIRVDSGLSRQAKEMLLAQLHAAYAATERTNVRRLPSVEVPPAIGKAARKRDPEG